jgi:hypothetical protein
MQATIELEDVRRAAWAVDAAATARLDGEQRPARRSRWCRAGRGRETTAGKREEGQHQEKRRFDEHARKTLNRPRLVPSGGPVSRQMSF